MGERFVDFGLPRLDLDTGRLGDMVWISDFVGDRGASSPPRIVLLNFFAVWCEPCFDEMRTLDAWQRRLGPGGLRVLSVNFRDHREDPDRVMRVTRARLQGAVTFPLLFERYTSRNQQVYLGDHAVLPANLLIDADGTVLERVEGGTPEALQKLLRRVEERVYQWQSAQQAVSGSEGVP